MYCTCTIIIHVLTGIIKIMYYFTVFLFRLFTFTVPSIYCYVFSHIPLTYRTVNVVLGSEF